MKDRLTSPSFCLILSANFLLYFGFYLLLPVLPFYLIEDLKASTASVGLVLACYTVAALVVRPFSGYLLDRFARKPLYLVSFFAFTAVFAGYLVAGTLLTFTLLRMAHGLAFGTVSVAGNTMVIDITPSSRRGEALGYYGLANNFAMAIGPMAGLFLHDHYPFSALFACSLCSCLLGLALAVWVKAPAKQQLKKEPLSLDRFILLRGLPLGGALLLLSIPYGMTTTYIAMYGKSLGLTGGIGLFFTLMAVGTAVSRLFSGRQVDRGRATQVVTGGIFLVLVCYVVLALCSQVMSWSAEAGRFTFYGVALFLGVGFGSMFPAFNTMFVNLAPNNQRATATSTYLTSWDVGIGLGLTLGGYVAHHAGFQTAYLVGAGLIAVAMGVFVGGLAGYYERFKFKI
jgi:MFS family permease